MERTAMEHADAIVVRRGRPARTCFACSTIQPARVHVIHRGIDPDEYRPTGAIDALARYGIDPATPYVLSSAGSRARRGSSIWSMPSWIDPDLQIVLCAEAPDTPEIGREMEAHVAAARAKRSGVTGSTRCHRPS